ncbi:MAG: hypothetical protein ABIB71_01230 [Candidatus Woesearchaeota archaeon]
MKDRKLDSEFKCFIYFIGFPFYTIPRILSYWESNEELYIFRLWLNARGAILTKWWEKAIYILGWIGFSILMLFIAYLIISVF